jgi:hypothetical protein
MSGDYAELGLGGITPSPGLSGVHVLTVSRTVGRIKRRPLWCSALSGRSGPGEKRSWPPPSDGHGHVLATEQAGDRLRSGELAGHVERGRSPGWRPGRHTPRRYRPGDRLLDFLKSL